MIRHIYGLPFTGEDTRTDKEGLVFCMNVFIVADKYDVASLHQEVVPDFFHYASIVWQSEEFVQCVQKLCGPDAICLADPALQAAVANFFNNNMSRLTYHKSLVKMIEGDNSFTGRILAGMLAETSGSTRYLGVCHRPYKSNRAKSDCTHTTKADPDYLGALEESCVHCGEKGGEVYNLSGGGTAET
jgi:hypothetical protein